MILVIPRADKAFPTTGRGAYVEVHSMEAVAERSAAASFRLLWVLDPGDKLRFEALCRLAYLRGNLVFAVDELHEYCPNSFAAIGKYFKKLCLHGRHARVEVFGISQRPANLHKDFLSQATKLHVFRLMFPGDIKALKETIPDIERVRTFEVGQHITFPEGK